MLIIDKHVDYYDYLSNIYGCDKRVVLDRRGSIKMSDESIVALIGHISEYTPFYTDSNYYFFLLEIGYIQYVIKIEDIKFKKSIHLNFDKFISCSMEIFHTFKNNKHYFESPISIRRVEINFTYNWKKSEARIKYILNNNFKETITKIYDNFIDLPILTGTQITKIIDPQDIWKELQNYISSLNNDKDVSISMTDVERAEVHGFDKVTSFRNPIK